jgi:hypothetical protein
MHPDDAVEVTIRNHRPRRWPGHMVLLLVLLFLSSTCGVVGLNLSMEWTIAWVAVSIIALVGAIGLGLSAPHPISAVKLAGTLEPRPGGRAYSPSEIVRIDFGPDPYEDYVESQLPIRLCEVHVVLLVERGLCLIASVGEAVRLRDWAIRNGVRVVDSTNALEGARPDGAPDGET